MAWEMEGTDVFAEWFADLDDAEKESVIASVDLLEERGTTLGFPHTSSVESSQFGQMCELCVQHKGRPLRVLDAFDPRRVGLLLLGGDKTGDNRWYVKYVTPQLVRYRTQGGTRMARAWKEIKATASPKVRAAAARRTTKMIESIPLADLRRAREFSQATLADLLKATQPEVSKIEHRADLYVSTLRRYIEAMGGELEIVARFPDGSVRINQFEQVAGK